jgi:hypothetical protein
MLRGPGEVVRAHMGFSEDGDVTLNFYDGGGQPRAGFGVFARGEPTLQLADGQGNLRAAVGSAGLQGGDRPVSSMTLFDEAGRILWMAP